MKLLARLADGLLARFVPSATAQACEGAEEPSFWNLCLCACGPGGCHGLWQHCIVCGGTTACTGCVYEGGC